MKERLTKILEFFMPRTAVGFLVYGWLGAALVAPVTQVHWLVGFALVLIIWMPLWLLATKARDKQIENDIFLKDLDVYIAKEDNNGTTTTNNDTE